MSLIIRDLRHAVSFNVFQNLFIDILYYIRKQYPDKIHVHYIVTDTRRPNYILILKTELQASEIELYMSENYMYLE